MLPSQIILTICTAVITATVTLVAVHLTNRGNNDRLKIQLSHDKESKNEAVRREKLEELHVVSQQWSIRLFNHLMPYLRVMEGEIDYNKALDMTIESGKGSDGEYYRLQMLVELYFPSVKETFRQLLLARDEANDILSSHKSQYKAGKIDGRSFVDPMRKALQHVSESSDRLRDAIVSQSYGRVDGVDQRKPPA